MCRLQNEGHFPFLNVNPVQILHNGMYISQKDIENMSLTVCTNILLDIFNIVESIVCKWS